MFPGDPSSESDNYRGYSRSGNKIYLTSRLWNSDGSFNLYQMVETMIHETTHKVMGEYGHSLAFRESYWRQTENYFNYYTNFSDVYMTGEAERERSRARY
jgi:hypothetical protein